MNLNHSSVKLTLTCPPEMIPDEMVELKVIWRRKDEEEIYRGAYNQEIEGGQVNCLSHKSSL